MFSSVLPRTAGAGGWTAIGGGASSARVGGLAGRLGAADGRVATVLDWLGSVAGLLSNAVGECTRPRLARGSADVVNLPGDQVHFRTGLRFPSSALLGSNNTRRWFPRTPRTAWTMCRTSCRQQRTLRRRPGSPSTWTTRQSHRRPTLARRISPPSPRRRSSATTESVSACGQGEQSTPSVASSAGRSCVAVVAVTRVRRVDSGAFVQFRTTRTSVHDQLWMRTNPSYLINVRSPTPRAGWPLISPLHNSSSLRTPTRTQQSRSAAATPTPRPTRSAVRSTSSRCATTPRPNSTKQLTLFSSPVDPRCPPSAHRLDQRRVHALERAHLQL